MESQLERIERKVPKGSGYLVGNLLRQYAVRGTYTWQPAAYKLAGREGSFGLSGGYAFSYLVFVDGYIVSPAETTTVYEKMCKFVRQGENYVCDNMVLQNLSKLNAPSVDVCLVYDEGARTESQNYEVVRRLCPNDMDGFVVVPSRHTPTVKFGYKIEPYDLHSETLVIEATKGCVELAYNSAIKSLQELHIGTA